MTASLAYDAVKSAVLQYKLVPEAYRQKLDKQYEKIRITHSYNAVKTVK